MLKTIRFSKVLRAGIAACVAVAMGMTSTASQALEQKSIQLKWVYQAQFAGYIVTQTKGYYKAHGLVVTIKPGGPDLAPPQVRAGGGIDFAVDWLPSALSVREKGVPMVNIAQFFTRAGGLITCWKILGKTKPEEYFKGKTVGVAFGGNEYTFLAFASHLHLTTSGSNPDVKLINLGFNVGPLLPHQADCIATRIYNEYYQIRDAGVKPDQLITFAYSDYHVDTLEDGLYALAPKLVGIDDKGIGYLDPVEFDQTVDVLLAGGSTPIITKKPEVAWTHAIWDKAETELKK